MASQLGSDGAHLGHELPEAHVARLKVCERCLELLRVRHPPHAESEPCSHVRHTRHTALSFSHTQTCRQAAVGTL
eukprot:957618-Rhodomonas_salina.2